MNKKEKKIYLRGYNTGKKKILKIGDLDLTPNSRFRLGYNQALAEVENRVSKCKTAWKIKDYKSYIRTDWILKLLKKLKKKEKEK